MCHELAKPIFAPLRPGQTDPFEEMLLRWRAVGNTVSNFIGLDLSLKLPVPETNALQHDQLPVKKFYYHYNPQNVVLIFRRNNYRQAILQPPCSST